MPETRAELGRAVTEVLERLNVSPETAGAALGLNGKMLAAMAQGIVPMRSLVIRFADGLTRHCRGSGDTPEWWSDADAWLRLAGYPPRQESGAGPPAGSAGRPAPRPPTGPWQVRPHADRPQPDRPQADRPHPGSRPAPPPRAPAPPPSPEDDLPAREYYRPVYRRDTVGDVIVHVFQILDPMDNTVFEHSLPVTADYRAVAAKWKEDLAAMSRSQFERKYGRHRVREGLIRDVKPGGSAGRPG